MDNQLSSTFHNSADTEFTRKQMNKALTHSLKNKYGLDGEELKEAVYNMMSIHGLSKDNFNGLKVVQKLIGGRINDISIDDNSNKNEKTVASLFSEAGTPLRKIVGYDFLYRVLKEEFGKIEAKRLVGEMLDLSLGLSDSSNILVPYCWALDASKLVTIGRDFGMLPSKPCKRIDSYISALCETIHQISNHIAGAVAIGTLFFDLTHLSLIKQGLPLQEVLENGKTRKHIENEFQQFVHSVNHLSRMSAESAFTNLSIFDRAKIRSIIENDFSWYFPKPYTFNGDDKEWVSHCTEYVYALQMIFLDFFDKGDPLNSGLPYRFPVVTINFTKVKNGDEWEVKQGKLLDDVLGYDIYRYNIFASEGTKTASCCRMLSDNEMLEVAGQSNSFGAGALASLGSHRVVTINYNRIALEADCVEDFWAVYKKRIEDAKNILIAHKRLLRILTDAGLESFLQSGWIQFNRLFSTFGILGIYECAEVAADKYGVHPDSFKKEVLVYLDEQIKKYTQEVDGYVFNIEQIPGESFAVRLADADRIIFGDKVPYKMYANQFVPLWEDATIFERLEADGKYNQLLTGGGIVHATIGEKVAKEQAEKIIKYAVKVGCEHFALNAIYSKCCNGHTTFGDVSECPQCGGGITDKLTRVVGFFTPVQSWNKTRREWEFPRRKKVVLDF